MKNTKLTFACVVRTQRGPTQSVCTIVLEYLYLLRYLIILVAIAIEEHLKFDISL